MRKLELIWYVLRGWGIMANLNITWNDNKTNFNHPKALLISGCAVEPNVPWTMKGRLMVRL